MPGLLLSLLTACGGVPPTEFTGSVSGYSLGEVGTAMFGGPFVIFTDLELDCMELAWVERYYDQEAPTELELVGLQFTFAEDEITTGRFDLGGDAAVSVTLMAIAGDTFTTHKARGGTLTVDEIDAEDSVSGTAEIEFDDGELTADWAAEWCVNVSE